ncbi:anti-CBASS protein Acb1 family protein [Citrobacter arsenatis]|uniref:anti-CBASS protein Acb1 family protein n=1 Tax=Citrobacter arsenatis TaxID=2546350 RepID=UPI00300DD352
MAEIETSDIALTSELAAILSSDGIEAGTDVGYKTCKLIWQYHPLGGKLVEKPITMALCKPRRYELDTDPQGRIVQQFEDTWKRMKIEEKIRNFFFVSRCYGAASIGVGTKTLASSDPLPDFGLKEEDIFINVWDPLNTAGSGVTSQDPNSPEFQSVKKTLEIVGQKWHPSRTQTVFNGTPIYLEYQSSAFGFTGRSVFQRILYPLKSFIGTMTADDLVAEKCGVMVAKTQQNGSVASGIVAKAMGKKREIVKLAKNKGVISIATGEDVESLNLQNIDKALDTSRSHIIENIAAGSDVPAILIKDEAFANGWGDGSEDSKSVSQYIDGVREGIDPVMAFFESIVQYIAWNEDFYNALKADFPDIVTDDYQTSFLLWRKEFKASWIELVEEPPAKQQECDNKAVEGATKVYMALVDRLDPPNKAALAEWLSNVLNNTTTYGEDPLMLDTDTLSSYEPPTPGLLNEQPEKGGGEQEEE